MRHIAALRNSPDLLVLERVICSSVAGKEPGRNNFPIYGVAGATAISNWGKWSLAGKYCRSSAGGKALGQLDKPTISGQLAGAGTANIFGITAKLKYFHAAFSVQP